MVRHFHELRSAYGTSLFEIFVKVCKFSITSNLLEPSSRICSSWGRPCTSETTCTRKVKGMNQRQVGRSIGDDILSSADSYHYFIILKENETKMELLKSGAKTQIRTRETITFRWVYRSLHCLGVISCILPAWKVLIIFTILSLHDSSFDRRYCHCWDKEKPARTTTQNTANREPQK